MSISRNEKLNHLLTEYAYQGIYTSPWLREKGYSNQLIKRYCDAGWLSRLGKGAFGRLKDKIAWEQGVAALQCQLYLPVHAGGITALELFGISHYASLDGNNPVFTLFNSSKKVVHIPSWFTTYFDNSRYYHKKLFSAEVGLIEKKVGEHLSIKVSIPERAILEAISISPQSLEIQYVAEIMESLHRLRSTKLQELLEHCVSDKVKRVFLCLSEIYNLDFFPELDLTRVSIGKGKRVIGIGGVYYTKWKLSLPKEISENSSLEEEGA